MEAEECNNNPLIQSSLCGPPTFKRSVSPSTLSQAACIHHIALRVHQYLMMLSNKVPYSQTLAVADCHRRGLQTAMHHGNETRHYYCSETDGRHRPSANTGPDHVPCAWAGCSSVPSFSNIVVVSTMMILYNSRSSVRRRRWPLLQKLPSQS